MKKSIGSLVLSLVISAWWPLTSITSEIVGFRLVPEVLSPNPGLAFYDPDYADHGVPENAVTVAPGELVFWEVWVLVRGSDNHGLALVSFDLVQDEANPVKFDLPPADDVPDGMENFARPDGIANPPEGGDTTGYVGAQRGQAGAMNLAQVGGAQNTFGEAGVGMGENPYVMAEIGLGEEVLAARGSFPAPPAAGVYTFRLLNARANLLKTVGTPPAFSQVEEASVVVDPVSIQVLVVIDKPVLHQQR